MKKILVIATILAFSSFSAQSEILSIGLSGTLGVLNADATSSGTGTSTGGRTTTNSFQGESTATEATAGKRSEDNMAFGYGSVFAEVHLGPLRLGIDYVPMKLESETTESKKAAIEGEENFETAPGIYHEAKAAQTNKVQVDFEDLRTLYASLYMNSFYLKAGIMEADVITNEKLGTGSKYGNTTLEGTLIAVGYEKSMDNGYFVRGEVQQLEIDDMSLTSTGSDNTNVIKVKGIEGMSGMLSVGKSF
jgi:hypothetical protein